MRALVWIYRRDGDIVANEWLLSKGKGLRPYAIRRSSLRTQGPITPEVHGGTKRRTPAAKATPRCMGPCVRGDDWWQAPRLILTPPQRGPARARWYQRLPRP